MGSSSSPPARARLVVLFGGRSAEHDVSCVSAASVVRVLHRGRYQVHPVGITRAGRWVAATGGALEGGADLAALAPAGPEVDPLATMAPAPADGDVPTVVLPLLHGPLGEDGTVQGLLELAGVAYVGAGVLGSALCMDKAKAKEVLAHHGLPQARYLALREVDVHPGLAERVGAVLGWPVFVKPSNLGSSVGISKVEEPAGLDEAVDLALAYDEWVVIEEGVTGREIECGVLGDVEPVASVAGEILPSREFYDYEDKYSGDGAELVVPARLAHDVAEEVRRLAVAAAVALRAEGMARVDFFFEEGGRGLLVNEVNTIPGFTPHSMYPRLWEASGVPYAELIDRLVASALERHRRRSQRVGRPRPAGPT
ncbi:MAG: D-alanine--D-alanine ligase [Actinomycetota bacterium]|nr:D-alanine--D-alanine ligase [Actinomycetota bacterium]